MRCSARRSRAAATISIARVIFWMFLTEEMRFLTSRCDAMAFAGGRLSGRLRLLLALGGALDSLVAAQRRLVLQRLALLVEVVAEVGGERLDGVVHGLLRVVRPVATGDLLA